MKTQNQDVIQLLMDEGEYAPLYPLVLLSNLSDFQKILVSIMLNDINMNGCITWKHETYASKMNASRMGICKQFKVLTSAGILVPYLDNKAGSKNNKFTISFSAISEYEPKPDNGEKNKGIKPDNGENMSVNENLITESTKPDNLEHKPDNLENKPDNGEHKPDNGRKHIKKLKETIKETNKEIIKDSLEDSFFDDVDLTKRYNYKVKAEEDVIIPKKDIDQDDLEKFLQEIDHLL